MQLKYEKIITIIDIFNKPRHKKFLLPYTEFLSFIREINRGSVKEVYEELYFMALEQIRTNYIPVSGIIKNII